MDLSKFTKKGKFLMLALDHRGSIKKLMNPNNPNVVLDEAVIQLKNDIIESLKDEFSALLIDETWGLSACSEVCQTKPFLLPLEKSGYVEKDGERLTELEYSVEQIKNLGASGAKLLIYFNPNAKSINQQLEIAKKLAENCRIENFPLFLEVVTYQLLHDRSIFDMNLILVSLKKFIDNKIKPDVWKLEYPGNLEDCQKITEMVGETSWISLTGGQNFEDFKAELEIAAKAGAKGFLAGRALWQEICTMEGEEKQQFLRETLPQRFKEISEIVLS